MGFRTINGKRVNISNHSRSGEIHQKPANMPTEAEKYREKIRRIKAHEEEDAETTYFKRTGRGIDD